MAQSGMVRDMRHDQLRMHVTDNQRSRATRFVGDLRMIRPTGAACAHRHRPLHWSVWACWLALGACTAGTGSGKSRGGGSASSGTARSGLAGSPSTGNANNSDVLLVPAPTTSSGPASGANGCLPGHYVGLFVGTYNSAAWGNGLLPLTVAAVDSFGQPGLEFWLEKTTTDCAGAEFCADFTVKGGKIRGFADPFSDGDQSASDDDGFALAIRFEIDFGGELDCSRGQFRGLLQNGCYDVATFLFRFEGTAPATYDHASSSFKDGQWAVKELAMPDALFPPDPSIGGMGIWEAGLVQDNSVPMDATAGLCHM